MKPVVRVHRRFPLLANFARLVALVALIAFGVASVACEPPPISELAAEQGIQRIRERHADSSWDKVVSDVNEFRSRYPYTQFASEAELLQADAYFQSSRYPEAIVSYEDFLRKSPSHGNADLAFFRIGRSYDLQSPVEIDREQANSLKAIEKYATFLERFNGSRLVPEAKERIAVLRRRVADHSAFIARFYWKKDLWQGALTRYLEILRDFPTFPDLREEASERAAACYEKLADELERDPKSDMSLYFRDQTPADLRKKAKDALAMAPTPPKSEP
ncbi:MAG: outer membrane protein assembly factor BamD [Silvanigrellales bacterium]|nr:outer membrane protein assembly factor BamD [Silvanigrellales bacterium]